jgi:hypothetical protein
MKQKYLLLLLILFSAFSLQAQIKVTGTITEAGSNEPLFGATILEKGTTNGTVTDFDGKYELDVSSKDVVLVFSYTGFSSQEITVGDQTIIDMVMESDIANLDEIVVVGYGTQKKAVVTRGYHQSKRR